MRHVVTGVLAAAVVLLSIAIMTTPDNRVEASSETYRQLNLFGDVLRRSAKTMSRKSTMKSSSKPQSTAC